MHELALAQSIAEAGRKEMAQRKLRKVTAMHVTVGGLSHVEPTNLVFCFRAAVRGTELDGCELIVDKRPIRQVKAAAHANGTRSLRLAALELVRRGATTLAEIKRVTLHA